MLGVTFGNKHSYDDWGVYLEDTHVNPPLPKRYIVDVPARNGLLDLTPELTPTIRFENRTLTFTFRVKAGDWSTLLSEIYGQIHGQTLDVVSDLDPQWHWHGCVTVDDFSSDERTGVLVITVDADPFKLSNTENSYTVNGNGTITCVVDRMEISPAFEIDAQTTVIYGDSSYTITSTQTTEKTASGDIVSFGDGTDNPVEELKANIVAVQSGNGDQTPDNLRPIIGWSDVNVNVTGKNLFGGYTTSVSGADLTVDSETGTFTTTVTSGGNNRQASFTLSNGTALRGKTVTFSITSHSETSGAKPYIAIYKNGVTVLGTLGVSGQGITTLSSTFTIPSDTKSLLVIFRVNQGACVVGDYVTLTGVQLEINSTATSYEPFGNTYTTSLGSTYYGGTLDVTTGVLTVTYGIVVFRTGNYTISGNPISDYTNTYVYSNGTLGGLIEPNTSSEVTKAICNYLPSISRTQAGGSSGEIGIFQYHEGGSNLFRLAFPRTSQFSTSANVMTWLDSLGDSPFSVVYPLKNTYTVQLSPQEVRTVLGQNDIWADSGSVQVNYIAQDFAGRKFYIPDLELTEGSHPLTIQGTGTTTVTYTNGRL